MSTSPRRFGAVLLAAALLVGACADSGEEEAADNPRQAFADAIDAMRDYDGYTFVMTLAADPADLATEETPEAVAEAVTNSSVTLSVRSSETAEDSQAALTLNVDGNEDAVELRGIGGSLYARVDVRGLVESFEGDMTEIDAAVQQASASGFDFARALADGEWVGVEGLDELQQQFGLAQATADPEEAAAFTDRLLGVLEESSEVASEGTDDVGAHLTVTLPLKETAQELLEALQSFGGAAAAQALPAAGLDEVPAADIPLDVWISDGRLVQLEADFLAIAQELGEEAPEDVDRLGLRVTIDEFTDEVEAPEDFVEINLQQILQGILGVGASMGTLGGSTVPEAPAQVDIPDLGLSCSDLQGLPPDQIKTFLEASGQPGALEKVKKACPGLF